MSAIALTRLVAAGSRESRARLAGIAAGVMIGVALFLLLWAASDALAFRTERSTWMQPTSPASLDAGTPPLAADEVALSTSTDHVDGLLVTRVDVASATGSTAELPGIGTPPAPGEYVASPALAALIAELPADQLGDRYGVPSGTISPAGLEGPDALVVVHGTTVDDLLASQADAQVTSIFVGQAYASENYRTIAVIGAFATLIPVLLLIAIVTDLGRAQRAERFATLRLIGATPRRVARIAALETGAVTAIGAVLGIGLYGAVVPVAAGIRVGSGRFYAEDLLLGPVVPVAVAVLTVLAACAVAWWRTLRADVGPLGAARERAERPPRPASLAPLGVGLVVLTAVVSLTANGIALPFAYELVIGGFLLTALGLLAAGPFVTRLIARTAARRARTAPSVLALARIERRPRGTFRTVSGLVIAVYLVSVFAAGVTTAAESSLVADDDRHLPGTALVATAVVEPDDERATALVHELDHVDGVLGAATGGWDAAGRLLLSTEDARRIGLRVPAGATGVAVDQYAGGLVEAAGPDGSAGDGYAGIVVATNGSDAAIERARTAIVSSGVPLSGPPTTRVEDASAGAGEVESQYAAMAIIGIAITTGLSAAALVVSTISGILDRRRVLGLLRLTGMPVSTFRRMIAVETLLPVATVFLGCVALGFYTAWAVIAGITSGRRTIGVPDASYIGVLCACALLMAGAVLATFRTADRSTAVTSTRFE